MVRYVSCHITIIGQFRRKFCPSDPKCITWTRTGPFFCFLAAEMHHRLALTSPCARGELQGRRGSVLFACTSCRVMQSASPLVKRGQITLLFAGLRSVLGDSYRGSAHRQEIVKFQSVSWVCPSLFFRLQVPGSRSCFFFKAIFSNVISYPYCIKKKWVLLSLRLILRFFYSNSPGVCPG